MKNSSEQGQPVVRFEKVQKAYDAERFVVRNLDLDIARGEFLTMLGPSGSGKTTTLMMLAGFETPTNGEIFLNGRPTNRIPPHLRNIGVVFQNYALFPHMTIAENLAFPLEVRRMAKAEREERVRTALDMVELSGFGARRPAQLSGGQQQRIALARALVFEPEIVLMDEPLGALDKRLREQLQSEIKALHRRLGVTIVYVTHDQSEALTMSDRVAVFDQGVIVQLSSPKDLYENPQTPFVADFIGENNKLHGIVEDTNADGTCAIRLDRERVVAARIQREFSPGEAVTLAVRPERIRIGVPDNEENAVIVEGEVKDVIYYGDHTRICLSLPGQPSLLVVKRPNDGNLENGITVGARLPVYWSANDGRIDDVVGQPHGKGDHGR